MRYNYDRPYPGSPKLHLVEGRQGELVVLTENRYAITAQLQELLDRQFPAHSALIKLAIENELGPPDKKSGRNFYNAETAEAVKVKIGASYAELTKHFFVHYETETPTDRTAHRILILRPGEKIE